MQKEGHNLTFNYQFLMLGIMFLIQTRSLKPQEHNGMIVLPLIALEDGFQYLSFLEKMQTLLWCSCATLWFLGVGFA